MRRLRPAALALACAAAALPAAARAGCEMDVAAYVGWQVIYAGRVTGSLDGRARREMFEGCAPGRVLLLDDDRRVVCETLRPGAGWQPQIVVLSDGRRMVACIADQVFAVRD